MGRDDALKWLCENESDWPAYIDKFVTCRIFGNWRFVDALPDREIVFANCIDACITKSEWESAAKVKGRLQ